MLIFFFSSRRGHTRCSRDWSSDVCSSDLGDMTGIAGGCFEEVPLPEPTMSASNMQKGLWVEMPKLKVVS